MCKVNRKENDKHVQIDIQVIHVTDLISTNEVINEHIRVKEDHYVFFHGTRTHNDAMNIAQNGILLNRGENIGNFSNKQSSAFYVTQTMSYAKSWVSQNKKKEYAIVVFKIPKVELNNFNGLNLEDNKQLWLEVVQYFSPINSTWLKKADCRRLEEVHGVLTRDYISGNITTTLSTGKKKPFVPDVVTQLAIKSERLAQVFSRASYMSLLLYAEK